MEKVIVSDVMLLNLGSSYVNLHLVTENWCPLPVSAKDNKLGSKIFICVLQIGFICVSDIDSLC